MCAEVQVSFLDRLLLRQWYKYVLYLSAILLILAVSINVRVDQSKLLNFSVYSIILSCLVWIINETLRVIYEHCEEEKEKIILGLKIFVDWIAFLIWVVLILTIWL